MGCYDVYSEKNYIKIKSDMQGSPMDYCIRTEAIHEFKSITASTERKLFEVSGWYRGRFPDIRVRLREVNIPWLEVHMEESDEFYRFINCLMDSYNSNEYRKRKITVQNGLNGKTIKKRFKSYKNQSKKELREFSNAYRSDGKTLTKHTAMRMALLFYNTMLNTYFVRKFPNRISKELYDRCIVCGGKFSKMYELCGDKAILTHEGKVYNKSLFRGIYAAVGDEISWYFTLYFLSLIR